MEKSGKNSTLTAQNKLIFLGLFLSTTFIILIAYFAITNIQTKLNDGYKNFGQILSKTLAIETVEITKDIPEFDKYNILRTHSISILKSNEDIAFIEFKDNKGEEIYSSKEDYPKQAYTAKISVSSPMIIKNENGVKTVGSVMVGLSGGIIDKVSNATKASLVFVFAVTWIVFSLVILLNTYLMARELKILHFGVGKISTGEFGYKIDGKGVSSEVKELFNAFNDMSTRLHLYEEQNIETLTLEKNKLEAVLMSIANGVVVCDNFDNVVLINNHAKFLLDAKEEDLLNSKIQQYCDTDGEFCFTEKIDQFKNTPLDEMEKKPLEFSIEVDKRIIKALISPMFSRNKDYVGYIIVLIDITKETEMDKLRNHFISNVSHELRTPVTVLRSYIDTLYNYGETFDFNTQKDFISVMNQEIIRLNKMVNEILDFSRLESNSVKVEKQMVNMPNLIDETVRSMDVLAQENKITFSTIIEPDLPEVVANYETIQRALSNLISNAIKYSSEGKRVKIRAERARIGDFLEVSVEDQGIGIDPKHHKKIFDRFYRIENETHTVKGTGLGLHLVKIAIEKYHNGQVFVESKVGEGSTFGFRLPLNITLEEANKEEEYEHPPVPVDEMLMQPINGEEKNITENVDKIVNEDFLKEQQFEQSSEHVSEQVPEQSSEQVPQQFAENKIKQPATQEGSLEQEKVTSATISSEKQNVEGWEISFEEREI